jgi:hypothetical protein
VVAPGPVSANSKISVGGVGAADAVGGEDAAPTKMTGTSRSPLQLESEERLSPKLCMIIVRIR